MATTKPSWITLSKTSGSGDETITITATAHTGRIIRDGLITVTGANVSEEKTFVVKQNPLALFASFDNSNPTAESTAGSTVTVTGVTNAYYLRFYVNNYAETATAGDYPTEKQCSFKITTGSGASARVSYATTYDGETAQTITLPDSYTANGESTDNGGYIGGKVGNDPGAAAQWTFSIVITFESANSATLTQDIKLSVLAYGSDGSTVTASTKVSQASGNAFLNIYSDSGHTTELDELTFAQDGTDTKYAYIDANTSWTIS